MGGRSQENTEELIKVAVLGNYPYRIIEPQTPSDPDWQDLLSIQDDLYYTDVGQLGPPGHGNIWGTATNGLIEQDYCIAAFTGQTSKKIKHGEMMSAIYNLADPDASGNLSTLTYNTTTMQPTVLAEWFAQFVTTTDYFKYDN